jgi:hypothetical protein
MRPSSMTYGGAAGDADRIFGAHVAHLRRCDLRCSLTHPRDARAPLLGASAGVPITKAWEGPLDTESLGRPSGRTPTG